MNPADVVALSGEWRRNGSWVVSQTCPLCFSHVAPGDEAKQGHINALHRSDAALREALARVARAAGR